jgi:hypothetical protein
MPLVSATLLRSCPKDRAAEKIVHRLFGGITVSARSPQGNVIRDETHEGVMVMRARMLREGTFQMHIRIV